jgi:hypothetical protein
MDFPRPPRTVLRVDPRGRNTSKDLYLCLEAPPANVAMQNQLPSDGKRETEHFLCFEDLQADR